MEEVPVQQRHSLGTPISPLGTTRLIILLFTQCASDSRRVTLGWDLSTSQHAWYTAVKDVQLELANVTAKNGVSRSYFNISSFLYVCLEKRLGLGDVLV